MKSFIVLNKQHTNSNFIFRILTKFVMFTLQLTVCSTIFRFDEQYMVNDLNHVIKRRAQLQRGCRFHPTTL